MNNLPQILLAGGAGMFAVGELIGAFNKKKGDTFSEWWVRQPTIVQYVILIFVGMVISHFARWMISDPDKPDGPDTVVNVEVNEAKSP